MLAFFSLLIIKIKLGITDNKTEFPKIKSYFNLLHLIVTIPSSQDVHCKTLRLASTDEIPITSITKIRMDKIPFFNMFLSFKFRFLKVKIRKAIPKLKL